MTTRTRADTIYLDNNATTPMLPEVAEAIYEAHRAGYANPASQHQPGQRAHRELEAIREEVSQLLGAQTDGQRCDRLIFTSGGTESNNLAIRGLSHGRSGNVIVSGTEHPSALLAAEDLCRRGLELRRVPVAASGVIRLEVLAELLDGQTLLASLVWGNHETGVLQPLDKVAELCASARVPLHADAAQVVGKWPFSFR
ncbi:MAG TPA: aminotransferase class V-fold PLP-dependent enzyme, partial [Nitrospiraceae bacterium]|nr:aminotransferase class V-fold PLP-dependent enzyme [Nitrospiraceae bacterium]